jgi:hypothetical protein
MSHFFLLTFSAKSRGATYTPDIVCEKFKKHHHSVIKFPTSPILLIALVYSATFLSRNILS